MKQKQPGIGKRRRRLSQEEVSAGRYASAIMQLPAHLKRLPRPIGIPGIASLNLPGGCGELPAVSSHAWRYDPYDCTRYNSNGIVPVDLTRQNWPGPNSTPRLWDDTHCPVRREARTVSRDLELSIHIRGTVLGFRSRDTGIRSIVRS